MENLRMVKHCPNKLSMIFNKNVLLTKTKFFFFFFKYVFLRRHAVLNGWNFIFLYFTRTL